ncbi:MAG: nucleoside triphosphate pyrophosphohydrolase, partial [Propionibacterium sp.]|nr:nucleoside triphosphate pyrophosphohydrolase [Propionibacterium sp.]
MRRLRADCPWDAQQTHRSLVQHLIEETAEVVEAIETEPIS